ncbi:MAG: hypothetical protein F6K10_41155 [Moorea sp. SIO2B7]|nr:hypothetical protein [Moorena sp. SIO2B7]
MKDEGSTTIKDELKSKSSPKIGQKKAKIALPKAQIPDVWYLGIDFGTIGLSAVLLNAKIGEQYPIYWSSVNQQENESSFRLPVAAYYGSLPSQKGKLPNSPFVVGAAASEAAKQEAGIFLDNFKPYLNLGVPYYSQQQHQWEPRLQRSEEQLISLYWIQLAVNALFLTLTPMMAQSVLGLKLGAFGLSQESLAQALTQLQGVIISCPAGWGDTYRFNLREAVLRAKLVCDPGQIFFVEEAIAALFGNLPINPQTDSSPPPITKIVNSRIHGFVNSRNPITTLVIHVGATTTELALVDLPDDIKTLTYDDFGLQSFAYGGNDLDQDILCQLIYPQWLPNLHQPLTKLEMEFPQPGTPDRQKRDRAALNWQSSQIGRSLLEAAKLVKLVLQKREELTSTIGNKQWGVKRQDLDNKVISPFIQQLNQQLNLLLCQTGVSEQAITSVICSGGTISAIWRSLSSWLKQKIPHGTLIHNHDHDKMSRVGVGLACIPNLPQVLDRVRHQYSDYFLLVELLEAIPNQPFAIEEIMHLLRERGLNTHVCSQRLIAFLNGELPYGLVPSEDVLKGIFATSGENSDYQQINAEPLFFLGEDRRYNPNLVQCQRLRQYLGVILSRTQQKLTEPLIFNLGLPSRRGTV